MTIFDEPSEGCFAERYYDALPNASNLKELHERIETDARNNGEEKKAEWRDKTARYNSLSKLYSETQCIHRYDDFLRGSSPIQCEKCQYEQAMKWLKIKIYEHP